MTNLATWLLENTDPAAIAIVTPAQSYSYADLQRRAHAVAVRVRELGDAEPTNERPIVTTLGASSFEVAAIHLGVLLAGSVSALLPPMSDEALAHVFAQTRPVLAFVDPSDVERARRLGARAVASTHEPLPERTCEPASVAAGATSVLLYTSGSTGAPRGVMLSATNIATNTEAITALLALQPSDRALLTLPMHYTYGLSMLHAHLRAGASVAITGATFPQDVWNDARTCGANGLPGVPTLFVSLLKRSSLSTDGPGALRYVMSSGGALLPATITALRAALPGVEVFLRYGITETTAVASCLSPALVETKPGSIGRGIGATSLVVIDKAGQPIAHGSVDIGEVVVRGPGVALGYFRDPEATARDFRDGEFFTGDLATVDSDGDVFLVGRERDFIKTAGHRVSPLEIEATLAQHPDVVAVAVIGIPDPLLGEALAAFVVPGAPPPSTNALSKHCAAHLPPFKVPSKWRLVDELPRTASGKIDRRALREK